LLGDAELLGTEAGDGVVGLPVAHGMLQQRGAFLMRVAGIEFNETWVGSFAP
jgi:hypothetical protein